MLDDNDRQRLRRVLKVVLLLQLHNSIRTRHYLHRPAIVMPSESPWQRLYEQADPSLFLHMTGLTRRVIFAQSVRLLHRLNSAFSAKFSLTLFFGQKLPVDKIKDLT